MNPDDMPFNISCVQYSKLTFAYLIWSLNDPFGFMIIPANGMYAGLHRYLTQLLFMTFAFARMFKYARAQQYMKMRMAVHPTSYT